MSITIKKMSAEDLKAQILIQKMLTGHCVEEIPEDIIKKVVYVWQGNGVWEVRKLQLGTFTTHTVKFSTPGLESNLKAGWTLNVPKIPASALDMTLSFFRTIYEKHSSEVFLQFFYDTIKEEYLLHCPKQTVSGASVNFFRDRDFETAEKILVFEIHSHGSMNAFFSGTDNGDEKDDRFFGVIGKVKQYYPEMKLRLSMGGHKSEIDMSELFDLNESSFQEESFPQEWLKNIQKEKKKAVVKRSRQFGPHTQRYNGRVFYPQSDSDESDEDGGYPGDGGFPSHSSYGDMPHQGSLFGDNKELKAISDMNWDDEDLELIALEEQMADGMAEVGATIVGLEDDAVYKQIGDKYFRVVEMGNKLLYEPLEECDAEEDQNDNNNSGTEEEEDTQKQNEEIIKNWRDVKW